MIYYISIFERPDPIDHDGRILMRLGKVQFEKICQEFVDMIQVENDIYRIDDKKIVSTPMPLVTIIVCNGYKQKDYFEHHAKKD